jgi:acyl-CoA synthetase (AMP-forming)/AMP-acid ligase II
MSPATTTTRQDLEKVTVNQSDLAAIMFSSGTTGKVKGVMLTHRNLMAVIAGYYPFKQERKSPTVLLYTVPYFHVFGFFYSFKSIALSETVVVMERFDLKKMLRAVEKFRVTHLAVAPPVVVAMTKSDLTDGYDLRSLETVGCGGAPLGKDVMKVFADRFPIVDLWQVSGHNFFLFYVMVFVVINEEYFKKIFYSILKKHNLMLA